MSETTALLMPLVLRRPGTAKLDRPRLSTGAPGAWPQPMGAAASG
jgi:hypothetical protein